MLVVIGAGPAGMAAALAAKESGIPDKDIIIIERAKTPGGILEQCIHTGFGLHYFKEEISGPEYAARFIRCLKKLIFSFFVIPWLRKLQRQEKLQQ